MFPWEVVPEFVVGRPVFDTWMVRFTTCDVKLDIYQRVLSPSLC